MNFSPARGTLIRGLLFFLLWWGGGAAAAGAEDNSEKLLKHGKVQVKPKPLARPAPVYPPELIRLGLEGRVTLRFVIDKEGAVTNPVVVQSNNPWFERPAITALLQWKFTPALVDGQAVNTRTQQEIVFDLWYGRGTPWTLTHTKAKNALPPEMRWDVAPEPVHTAYPVYPFDALQAGLAGKTRVLYVIDERGVVTETKLLEATTPEMGHAAIAMIAPGGSSPPAGRTGRRSGPRWAWNTSFPRRIGAMSR